MKEAKKNAKSRNFYSMISLLTFFVISRVGTRHGGKRQLVDEFQAQVYYVKHI